MALIHFLSLSLFLQADVFAYAMFLYEIMAMKRPFDGCACPEANSAIQRGERPKWNPEVRRMFEKELESKID